MASLRKSLLINFLQNYGIILLQFIGSVVLARLLSPEEIGIYSVAAALIAIAQTVRDFGVGQYIIQEKELTEDRIRAAFTVTLIVATLLAAITAASSELAAEFFHEPGVSNVMLVLAINFMVIPFGQITLGCLQRDMQFGAIAVSKVTSAIVHTAGSIALAYYGFSYMSLAWASLAGTMTSALVATWYRPPGLPWRPGAREIRHILSFGSYSVGSNIAIAIAGGIPDFVLGRMMNMTAVGLFSRAGSLVSIFHRGIMNALWAVALPHFSKTAREGGDLKQEYLHSAALITGVAWPFFAMASILAEPIVLLLYGPNWIECAPLVKWICLGFAFIAPFYLFGSVLVALGKIRTSMWIEAATLPVLLISVVVGAYTGSLELAAAAYSVYYLLKACVVLAVLIKLLNFRILDFTSVLWRSAAVTIFSCIGYYASEYFTIYSDNTLLIVTIGTTTSIAGWLTAVILINHQFKKELQSYFRRLNINLR